MSYSDDLRAIGERRHETCRHHDFTMVENYEAEAVIGEDGDVSWVWEPAHYRQPVCEHPSKKPINGGLVDLAADCASCPMHDAIAYVWADTAEAKQ